MTNTFGINLRIVREANGLSQIELAKRCGISQTTINRWETGIKNPPRSKERLQKIGEILNIDYKMLFAENSIITDMYGSFYTLGEAAKIIGRSIETTRKYVASGELHAIKISGRVGYRISSKDIDSFMNKRYIENDETKRIELLDNLGTLRKYHEDAIKSIDALLEKFSQK